MTKHLTDEDLVLHFYGEGPAEQESIVDAHLQSCAECQTLWHEITGTLKLVDAARVPEPAADFEQAMWARVQAVLPAPGTHDISSPTSLEAYRERRSRRVVLHYVMPAVGLAAAVLLAVFVGRGGFSGSRPAATSGTAPAAAVRAAADPRGSERVLLTALDEQFQRSETLLVEVMNGGANEMAFERQAADELLDSSRVYRVLAQQGGKVRLADMLEELESVLVEIARSPEKVDRKDFRSLRARIEADDLLFKVRVVSKQIQDRQRTLSTE